MYRKAVHYLVLLMLWCYSLVLAHSIISHDHDEAHHHTITQTHSFWEGLLGLLTDITQTDLGENHLQEYLKEQIHLDDFVLQCDILSLPDYTDQTATEASEKIETYPYQPARVIHLILPQSRRGPPILS